MANHAQLASHVEECNTDRALRLGGRVIETLGADRLEDAKLTSVAVISQRRTGVDTLRVAGIIATDKGHSITFATDCAETMSNLRYQCSPADA